MTKRKRKHYPEEFKRRAVAMLLDGKMNLTEVSKELEIPQPLLTQWKQKFELDASLLEAETKLSALEEVKILREELKKKTMENEILKNSENQKPPRRKNRGKIKNEPKFDVQTEMFRILGFDMSQVPGFGPYTVMRLIAECGFNFSKWPTAKHFTSWLTLCPGTNISGGKVLSSCSRKSTNRATTLFRICAVNVGKTQTALGAFYRRLAARIGKAKAVTATARKLAVIFYNAMRYGREYVEVGVNQYEEQYLKRQINGLKRKAESLGYEETPKAA